MNDEEIIIKLPKMTAAAIRKFLEGALEQMKEQASAVEWDSLEIRIMRGVLDMLIRQLPTEQEVA